MTYAPEHLKRWTKPDHYFGASWPEYFSSGVGRSRDSDCLEESNFQVMLERLGGESETVLVIRESHWAVGWVEWIAIHESDADSLEIADELKASLEDYPVLNEDHWSNLEHETASDVWRDCFDDKERLEYVKQHRDQFDFHDYADVIGCIRGRYFAGYASELLY